MSIIYETKGRAREYFELAANLYSGCPHGCAYCYGPDVARKDPGDFARPQARLNAGTLLEREAERMKARGDDRHVLLSFITDPYQPLEKGLKITRRAITSLHRYGIPVAILTKAPTLATRDFDLLGAADAFGTTLTFMDTARSFAWEPGADVPSKRINALQRAKNQGIPTWVSLEPVIDTAETLALIEASAKYVDHFKVGPLNYSDKLPQGLKDQVRRTDWKAFAQGVVILLDRLGKSYYIKKDLARYLGQEEGIRKGDFTAWI